MVYVVDEQGSQSPVYFLFHDPARKTKLARTQRRRFISALHAKHEEGKTKNPPPDKSSDAPENNDEMYR